MTRVKDPLEDEKELVILQALSDGASNVREIRQATTLSNTEVNYRISEKSETLEDRGLVNVGRSGGRIRVEEEAQLREYNAPKSVTLTAKGSQIVSEYERYDEYIDMDQQELVLRLVKLEERFESFQKQVKEELL